MILILNYIVLTRDQPRVPQGARYWLKWMQEMVDEKMANF